MTHFHQKAVREPIKLVKTTREMLYLLLAWALVFDEISGSLVRFKLPPHWSSEQAVSSGYRIRRIKRQYLPIHTF
jgi:hypothetical protein